MYAKITQDAVVLFSIPASVIAPHLRTARAVLVVAAALLLGAVMATPARAQCPEGWLQGQGLPGTNGAIYALAVLPGGDVIVGGSFSAAGGVLAANIARYNPTTRVWSALGGTNDAVNALAVLPGGDVIVGGDFTTAGSVAANHIARYSPTTGVWSALGSGIAFSADFPRVHALAVLPGGDVIVGGYFDAAGGVPAIGIARYRPTTGVWSTLGSGLSDFFSYPRVSALTVLPGGDLIAGGSFDSAGGAAAYRIARYNPNTNMWSSLGNYTNDDVTALAVLPGGDLIVGGDFTTAGSVAANHIARYSPTTGAWSSLGSGFDSGFPSIHALAVLPGGDVIVGGDFGIAGGVVAYNIARYRPSTSTWSAFGDIDGYDSAVVYALAALPGGDLLVGGDFDLAGGVAANNSARYNPTTGVWSSVGSGMDSEVHAFAVLPGGDVMVGGRFITTAGGMAASRIARYNPTTGVWSTLGSGTSAEVYALAVLPGGDLIVGGRFASAGGVVGTSGIARYNPTTGMWSALGSGVNDSVFDLAVLPDGDVVVGGAFTTAGGVAASRIARYNPTTGVWSALGSGVNRALDPIVVYALAVLPSGDVIVGGDFTIAGGGAASRIARYNPTTGVWSAIGSGTSNTVRALAVLPGGDVVAGGAFTTAGGVAASRIARYNPSTGVWSALGSGTSYDVNALTVLSGGDVIVGGNFATAGGVVGTSGIARYNPTTGVWSALGSGMNGAVFDLAVLPDGGLAAGGAFTRAGAGVSAYFARYTFGAPGPIISGQPSPQTACGSGSATFAVTASGTGPITYQWQGEINELPGTWLNISNGPLPGIGTFAGTSTSAMTITGVGTNAAGRYRCIVTTACGSITSNPALLTVSCPNKADVAHVGGAAGCDGQITVDDIVYYLSQFFAGNTAVADIVGLGGSGPPEGAVTVDDLVAFLNAFFAGCP